jgi:hypothetical protein
MTTLTDAEVEAFRNLCQLTYDRWITRRVIFEHADMQAFTYHKCADALRLLNDITIEHTLLQMAKLHDPAEQLGRKNLTLDYIVTYGGWDTQTSGVLTALRGRLDALLVKSLKPARNRVLEAYPVVPGLPRFRVRAAANPKRRWDWSFAKSLNHPAACRSLSFGAAAGAGWSARLCEDCRGR